APRGPGFFLCLLRRALEIGDQVAAVAGVAQADEVHGRARQERLRVGQPLVEVVHGPYETLVGRLAECRRIFEAALRAGRAADDAAEVRSGQVLLRRIEGVAGGAELEQHLAAAGAFAGA